MLIVTEIMLFIMSAAADIYERYAVLGISRFRRGVGDCARVSDSRRRLDAQAAVRKIGAVVGGGGVQPCAVPVRAIGPIISGVLYVSFSYRAAFAANALSYIPSIFLLLRIKTASETNKTGRRGQSKNEAECTAAACCFCSLACRHGVQYHIYRTV